MSKRLIRWAVALAFVGAAVSWWLSRPTSIDPAILAGLEPDVAHGEWVFNASGCASCHAAPGVEGDAKLILSGGQKFASPFGTFIAPNISPDPNVGIGNWTVEDLANAMIHGTSPKGQHYFPAFPYTSYVKAKPGDVVSLHAYLQTLPMSDIPSEPHDVPFPFNVRRTMGMWKLLFLRDDWIVTEGLDDVTEHGRYLVEGLGHCGECHTPRNPIGGLQLSDWLGGAANPSGDGRIPAISPDKLLWSERDIAEYLKSGFTPDFDSAGGHMTDVIANTSKLSEQDRAAMAAYIKAIGAAE